MSDLESSHARSHRATPISAQAIGKLRSIGGKTSAFAETDGLVDAFAEVFARMAVAEPFRSEPATPSSGSAEIDNHDSEERADDHVSQDSQQTESNPSEVNPEADQVVLETQQTVETESVGARSETDLDGGDVEAVSDIPVVEVAAIESDLADQSDDQVEVAAVVAASVADADGSDRQRRERRDSAVIDSTHVDDSGTGSRQRGTAGIETPEDSQESLLRDESLSTDSTLDLDGQDVPRRVRRHRHDRDPNQPNPQAVSQTNANGKQHVAQAAVQEIARSTPVAEASDSTPIRSPEATNASAAAVSQAASVAARGGASSPSSATTQGARVNAQGIEPLAPRRDGLAAKPAAKDSKNATAETVSRVKLIQRVSKAFQHLGPEGGVIRMRLAPAEMGSVRVEMRVQQRKVEARVVAETEAAGAALREHLPDLRQRLEAQGMQIERLEIETEKSEADFGSRSDHQGFGNPADDSAGQRQPWQRNVSAENRHQVSPSVSQTASAENTLHIETVSSGVDVRL